MTTKLTDIGFTPLDPTIHPRLIMSVGGREKNGKTHFAMTAPGPIALFNLDMGDEGVVHKFLKDKIIFNYEIEVPKVKLNEGVNKAKKNEAADIWDKFNAAYAVALKEARTVVIDTATELWELLRIARFGQLTQVMPYQYGPVNAEFRDVIRAAFKSVGTNVIFLHKVKAVYINDKRTGDYERAGFGDTGYLVQINAMMHRLDIGADRNTTDFAIKVEDCRQNANLMGQTLSGPMCTFPMVAQLALPDTKVEDWT